MNEKFSATLDSTPLRWNCKIDVDKSTMGLEYLASKKLVICALLRDSEESVDNLRKQTENVGKLFADYRVLIVENDSQDGTRHKLLNWAKDNPKVQILGCGINMPKCSLKMDATIKHDRAVRRIEKMVRLRNVYLDHLNSDPVLSKYDLVLVWDMDIQGRLFSDGLGLTGYYLENGIDGTSPDAICANGVVGEARGAYYDPYAHEDIEQVTAFTVAEDIRPPDCDQKAIKVRSCFNGFTFYRMPAFLASRYRLETRGKEAICEHVIFHKKMKMFMNPSLVYLMEYDDGIAAPERNE